MDVCWGFVRELHLLLYELQLLSLEQLLRHALRTGLGTQQECPQLLAERRRVLVQEAGELDLEGLYIRLLWG